MDEQFVLRVPPSVAERINLLLSENASSSEDKSLDLEFSEDGRTGTFVLGNERFPASLLDLPCVVESYKTYDDNALVKTSDIGQMILVRESGEASPDVVEYRHGLNPPMRDARKRRFRREPDLNPELVQRVEKDLVNIMSGGTVENLDILSIHLVSRCRRSDKIQKPNREAGDENARNTSKKAPPTAAAKLEVPDTGGNAGEPDGSESDDSDDSM
ncbi:TBP-associated factor 7 [Hibiscus trionum]|uniref:TBP-associated factor 7 n=1 Tax=Hibiscus trionum TaxID=183268 RepID=A0A9W7MI95_HIBTR|nr:TBP-associated factor 7 [Hibiscus trionum]